MGDGHRPASGQSVDEPVGLVADRGRAGEGLRLVLLHPQRLRQAPLRGDGPLTAQAERGVPRRVDLFGLLDRADVHPQYRRADDLVLAVEADDGARRRVHGDGADLRRVDARVGDGGAHRRDGLPPPFMRVLFGPSGLRIGGRPGGRSEADLAAAGVEHTGSGGSGAHVYSYDVAVVGHDCILPSVSPRHCGGVRRWIAPLAMDAFPAQTIRTAASPSSPDTRTGVPSAIAWAKARSSAM